MTSFWTTVCENLKHLPQRLPVVLRSGTDAYRRGHLISFASFQGDGEEESLFAAVNRMRPGIDPDQVYRHVFVQYIGRQISLQEILLSWLPEVIKTLHLTTEPRTVTPEAATEAASAKARWATEASDTNATGVIQNATIPITVTTATVTAATAATTAADSITATAILRRLQIRHDTLKAEYDLLVEAEAVQERTNTLAQQIAAKKASLLG